jgi:glutathione S-transferase
MFYSFRRCPYAMRARLALAVSASPCELREVVLKDKPAELLAVSAKATVPVLVLASGEVIDQSLDIMRWALAQHDPAHWLPDTTQAAGVNALINECDQRFKHHLDRYKYPGRFAHQDTMTNPASAVGQHRSHAAQWLAELELRLQKSPGLFGQTAGLADMAIAPFVRQFAQTDLAWFEAQDWPHLDSWLKNILSSELFARVMHKYPAWQPGATALIFPSPTNPRSN